MSKPNTQDTSRARLLLIIEKFLKENPQMTTVNFGWKASKDTRTVFRLREGSDISTAKMDAILSFISTYKGK